MRVGFLACLFTSVLVLLLVRFESPAVQAQADDRISATIFSQSFVREKGKPKKEEVTFSVPIVLEGPFRMIVENGNAVGLNQVRSIRVWLNGELVVRPSGFEDDDGSDDDDDSDDDDSELEAGAIEREVFPFQGETTLEVKLQGKPGSSVRITITGVADSADFEPTVPPDPGEAGKTTLAGIDSDGGGVRDDVQRYILANYFFTSPTTVMALSQLASDFQSVLLKADDAQTSIDDINTYFDSKDCLRHVRPSDWYSVAAELRQEFLNTELRSQAWNAAGTHYDGQSRRVMPLSETASECNFELVPGGAP